MKKALLLFFILFATNCLSQTVYVTRTGEKYHDQDCVHLKKSAISISLKEALESGYEACKVCKPAGSQNDMSNRTENLKSDASVQCSGKTKKGTRCKRITANANGRCYQH